jgi:hypothetical protein
MYPQITMGKNDYIESEPPSSFSASISNMDKMTCRSRLLKWRRSTVVPALLAAFGAFTACDFSDSNPASDDNAQAVIMLSKDPNNPEELQSRLVVKAPSKDVAKANFDEILRRLQLSSIRRNETDALFVGLTCYQRNSAGNCDCTKTGQTNCCYDCDN